MNVQIQRLAWFVLCVFLSLPALAKKEGELPGLQNPGFESQPSWFISSFLDLGEDIAAAAEKNKRLMMYFYQDGCPYCKKLLTVNFSQKAIVDKTRRNFDVLSLNMWGDREVIDLQGNSVIEKDLAKKFRVMFTPTILFFNEQGEIVLRVNGYYKPEKFSTALDYVAGKNENKMRFRDYLSVNSPAPSHGKLHKKPYFSSMPYNLTKRQKGNEFLLVLFEQKQCPACDELHKDMLMRKASEHEIRKFDVVQLDMWSETPLIAPNGKETTARQWAKELDVQYAPSFVFFDAEGKEIIRMDVYLKSFHVQSVMDYVSSKAYVKEPSFQRYIDVRAEELREAGVTINLMD